MTVTVETGVPVAELASAALAGDAGSKAIKGAARQPAASGRFTHLSVWLSFFAKRPGSLRHEPLAA